MTAGCGREAQPGSWPGSSGAQPPAPSTGAPGHGSLWPWRRAVQCGRRGPAATGADFCGRLRVLRGCPLSSTLRSPPSPPRLPVVLDVASLPVKPPGRHDNAGARDAGGRRAGASPSLTSGPGASPPPRPPSLHSHPASGSRRRWSRTCHPHSPPLVRPVAPSLNRLPALPAQSHSSSPFSQFLLPLLLYRATT
ncbi:unnamed protein product [Urochloa humidicola]